MYLFPKLPKLQKQLHDPSNILAIRSAEIVTRMPSHHQNSSFYINNLPLPLEFDLPTDSLRRSDATLFNYDNAHETPPYPCQTPVFL
jgi:hypothetical protein